MTILDLSSLHRGGGAGQPADSLQQRALTARGIIARAPTSESDSMHVVIKGMSLDDGYEVISGNWTPRGLSLPAQGAECLIVFDDEGDVTVPVWSGSTTFPTAAELGIARGSGTVTFSGASNSVAAVISHGLGDTPGYVGATETTANGIYFTVSKTSTQIQVVGWYLAAISGSFPFDWVAIL